MPGSSSDSQRPPPSGAVLPPGEAAGRPGARRASGEAVHRRSAEIAQVPLSLALAVTEARLAERRQSEARLAEREGLPHGSVDDARTLAKAIRDVADKLSGQDSAPAA